MTSKLLNGISIFAVSPLLIVHSFILVIVVFGAWFVQVVAFVLATRAFGDEPEGEDGG